jgi:hypothetical protein
VIDSLVHQKELVSITKILGKKSSYRYYGVVHGVMIKILIISNFFSLINAFILFFNLSTIKLNKEKSEKT